MTSRESGLPARSSWRTTIGRRLPNVRPYRALAAVQSIRTWFRSGPLPISTPNSVRLTTVGAVDCACGSAPTRIEGADGDDEGPGANSIAEDGLGQGSGTFASQS